MKVVYCTAEVAPFSKAGGLADVSLSLPKALSSLGVNIKVFTPLYSFITRNYELQLVEKNLKLEFGHKKERFDLFKSVLPDSNVEVFFVKHPFLYRNGIYVDENGEPYPDGALRFIFFSKAIFSILEYLNHFPDLLHINDWHTATVAYYLKIEKAEDERYANTKTVFTIHNIGYQGIFTFEKVEDARIEEKYLNNEFEFWGKCNLMKAGICFADIITTVSKKYSEEIQTEQYGFGLEDYIRKRKDDLYGIINGVDYSIWNPKVDKFIPRNYSFEDLTGKTYCKHELQKELGLPISDVPLLAVISRLDYQKGLELLVDVFDELAKQDIQFVLLGTGDKKLEERFLEIGQRYKDKTSINIKFDSVLAHKIEAGADIFLMPSRYEPCGLNQMYSMIYGTIPVVRNTGGLADTVKDVRKNKEEGTGFVFDNFDSMEFLQTVMSAIRMYSEQPEEWKKLMIRAMKQDFSWNRVAKEWIKVYKTAIKKK